MEANSPHGLPGQVSSRAPLPPSSDPRLKRSRPSVATSSFTRHSQHSLPSSPTTALLPTHEQAQHSLLREASDLTPRTHSDPVQNIDGSDLNGLLLEVMDARASRMIQIQERTKLEIEESSYQRDLAKAKRTKSFPATIESLEADAAACKNRLSKINHLITRQQARSTELTGDLAKLLRQTTNLHIPSVAAPIPAASGTGRDMIRLEDDVRKIKRTILIKKEEDLPDKPIDIFKVCNTVESQAKAHTTFRKSINAIEEWRSVAEHEPKTQQTQEQTSSRLEIEQLTEQARKTTENLSTLKNHVQDIHQMVQRNKSSVHTLVADQKSMETASSTQREELESKIATLGQNLYREQGQTISGVISDFTKKFDHISQRIDALKNSEQERGLSSEPSAGLREKVSDHDQRLIKMKEGWDDLLRRIPALYEASEEVKKCSKSYEGLATAIRSLELRYNNINTEAMVTKMAHVIQEMYPSARQLNEEVVALRNSVNQELSGIKPSAKIAQLQDQLDKLDKEIVSQKTICLHNTGMFGEMKGASDAKSNELEVQLQALKTQLGATVKLVDGLRLQPPMEMPPQSSSADVISATEAQEIRDQIRAMHETAKSEMVDLLANVNSMLSSQSTGLANVQELSGTNKASCGSKGVELTASNKRPREGCSDDDSPSAAATTTHSESPAPSSNPDRRIDGKSQKKKKKKKIRQSNLGAPQS